MKVKRRRRYQDLKEIIRILERRIRRRDPASLKQAVKNVVEGKDIGTLFKRRRTWLAWFLPVAALACILAAGGWYAYQQGWWFETFESGRYGALIVSAVVDSSWKEPEEVFFQPVLYREEDNQLTRIMGIDFGLHKDASGTSTESFTLSSKSIYLPAGRYRVKVSLEGELFWSAFTLAPRVVQRRLLSTVDGMRITVRQRSGEQLMAVSSTVTDSETGEDLASSAALSVFLYNRWMPWSSTAPQDFTSGGSYRFRIEKEGYYPQSYSLVTKPYQTMLSLDVRLVAQPGTLILLSAAPGAVLLLNGSDYYPSGGRDGRFERLAPLGIGTRQIPLSPGDYRLTVRRPPAPEKSVSFHVSPKGTLSLSVGFDAQQGILDVTMDK